MEENKEQGIQDEIKSEVFVDNQVVSEPMEENKTKEKGKGNVVLTIILVILLLGAVLFGGFILYDKVFKEDKTVEPNGDINNNEEKDKTEVRIDASLATQPLTDAFIKGLTDYNLKKEYTNTDPAYTKLINGETDLIIVTKPSAGQQKRADDAGVELVLTPVVNEGFVFYTNINNTTNNISLDNVRKIYTGAITNWEDLGGEDAPIIAYQRPANSGSQAGIVDLVMNGQKMKEPTTTEYVETMAGIIDVVSNYENGKNAIGYSYYYYATSMYGNDKMKFFSIDGVSPTRENIQNESYPLITSYYIVTRKDNKNEEVDKVKEAMLSSVGQEIAKNAGYVELG